MSISDKQHWWGNFFLLLFVIHNVVAVMVQCTTSYVVLCLALCGLTVLTHAFWGASITGIRYSDTTWGHINPGWEVGDPSCYNTCELALHLCGSVVPTNMSLSNEELQTQIANLQKQVKDQQKIALKARDLEAQLDAERTRAAQREAELKDRLDETLDLSRAESKIKTVYITKDTARIPKLRGAPKKEEDIEVDEWIDDVRRHLAASRFCTQEKVEFILQHLGGAAKCEVKFRTDSQKATPESILGMIQTVFGDPESVSTLQEAFWRRNQKPNESILDYSLELLKLHRSILKKDKHFGGNSMLKGKFTEGVREDFLRRELRSINAQYPDLEFWELRDRAIQ